MKIDVHKLMSLMGEKGINIKMLSEMSGVSKVTIHNILKGRTTTTRIDIVGELAKALGVEMKEFANYCY